MQRKPAIPICFGLAATLFLGSPALGQTLEQRGFEPVEQFVDDVDPLSRSLRQMPTGLREQAGQESLVYRRPSAADPERLYYIEPGVVAEFDRSEYFVIRDGPILQLVPPDTVFHLGFPPDAEPSAQPDQADHPLRIQARHDWRIAGRAAPSRIERPAPARPLSEDAGGADSADWDGYLRMLASQRRSVMSAIDRAVASDEQDGQ